MRTAGLPDVERDIAEMARRANLRLRFDKVALRVVGTLQSNLAEIVPGEEALLFTITAPIKLPSQTVAAIETLARGGPSGARIRAAVHGNDVRLRWIRGVQASLPKAIGFVHNPGSDAELLLDLAQRRLTMIETSDRWRD